MVIATGSLANIPIIERFSIVVIVTIDPYGRNLISALFSCSLIHKGKISKQSKVSGF